jgi:hypothetical protein
MTLTFLVHFSCIIPGVYLDFSLDTGSSKLPVALGSVAVNMTMHCMRGAGFGTCSAPVTTTVEPAWVAEMSSGRFEKGHWE